MSTPIKTYDCEGCHNFCYGGYHMEEVADGYGDWVSKEDHDAAMNVAHARIAELESQIAPVAPAVDAQPVAWMVLAANTRKPCEVTIHKSETEALRQDCVIPLYASAPSEGWRKDAERYNYLRRRAVMVDYSDDTVTKLTLFKEEGPTGEFLDDWVDGALSQKESGE